MAKRDVQDGCTILLVMAMRDGIMKQQKAAHICQ